MRTECHMLLQAFEMLKAITRVWPEILCSLMNFQFLNKYYLLNYNLGMFFVPSFQQIVIWLFINLEYLFCILLNLLYKFFKIFWCMELSDCNPCPLFLIGQNNNIVLNKIHQENNTILLQLHKKLNELQEWKIIREIFF